MARTKKSFSIWIARDKNNRLYIYENKPKFYPEQSMYEDDDSPYIEELEKNYTRS